MAPDVVTNSQFDEERILIGHRLGVRMVLRENLAPRRSSILSHPILHGQMRLLPPVPDHREPLPLSCLPVMPRIMSP